MSKVFIVSRTYLREVSTAVKSSSLYKDHLKYQDSLSEAKKIKLAFRDVDSKHAWHFFINTDSKAEVEKMVEGDPLRKEGYYDYEVSEIVKLRGDW